MGNRNRNKNKKNTGLSYRSYAGYHNPISVRPGDLTNARDDDHEMLPCGFTVAQSWTAMRKLWQGYRIAKQKETQREMFEYAKKINKVRGELGIPILPFNSLDATSAEIFEMEMKGAEGVMNATLARTCHYVVDDPREPVNERVPDYDVIMHEAFHELGVPAPPPSDDIFVKRISKKSCIYKKDKKKEKKGCLYQAKRKGI